MSSHFGAVVSVCMERNAASRREFLEIISEASLAESFDSFLH